MHHERADLTRPSRSPAACTAGGGHAHMGRCCRKRFCASATILTRQCCTMSTSGGRVAILHPEIKSHSQRGIHAYGRSLIANLHQRSNWLMTDAALHRGQEHEASVLKALIEPPRGSISSLRCLPQYLLHQIGHGVPSHAIGLSQTLIGHDKLDYLAAVNGFINLPGFYEICRLAGNKPGLCEVNLDFLKHHGCGTVLTSTPMSVRYRNGNLVQTVHDLIILNEAVHQLNKSKFRRRLDSCMRHSDVVIAVSEHTRSEIVERYPQARDRVRVIYQPLPSNAVNIELSQSADVQKQVLSKFRLRPQNYIFFVGAIEERKNVARLIQAFQNSVVAKDYRLVLAGALDEAYAFRERFADVLHRENIMSYEETGIQYIGMISDLEKLCLLRNARLFAFPSLMEGFGIPVLEAQAMGCPVLTSNTSALPEVAGAAAVMIDDPRDTGELASKLAQATQDDALNAHLRQAGLLNSARFHKDVFAQQLNALIDSL
ncbi:MAG: glycosyltransferase family 1 protein [Rubrivivax sp.]|nr:MAG: glycosyltransferase family 1 protein [Rubrivivax sp.]